MTKDNKNARNECCGRGFQTVKRVYVPLRRFLATGSVVRRMATESMAGLLTDASTPSSAFSTGILSMASWKWLRNHSNGIVQDSHLFPFSSNPRVV